MHKQMKKWISAVLTAAMLVPAVPADLNTVSIVQAAEQTQIASPMENVYLNHYAGTKRSINFNNDWKFYLGEASGAEAKVYNDAEWESLNLPHDYSIDQEYNVAGEAESGFLLGGVGWYRKTFTVDSEWQNKRITINFDGVYMDSTVYLNGVKLGGHAYGYTPFSFELPADVLDFEGENVIVVKVNHQTPSSRWYSGSGIYRDVTIDVMDKVHIDRYGVSVTTSGLEEAGEHPATGTVNVETAVVNDSAEEVNGVKIKYTIYEKGVETEVASKEVTIENAIAAGNGVGEGTSIEVSNPKLWHSWDTGEPSLYVLNTKVLDAEGNKLDEYETTFGFRYFEFDRNKGFAINGEYIKLKGVCMHHDQGALGAEAWEDAIRRQVQILKGMGCNSIRVTHNPAAEILLEICNEEGMLIIEEAFDGWDRLKNSNSNDYARFFGQEIAADNHILGKEEGMQWAEYDIKSMVLRGKNAPCIIMWSLGNEIIEGSSGCGHYPEISERLIAWINEVETDSNRKITFGDNHIKNNNETTIAVANKIHQAGGLVGVNYTTWATLKEKTATYGNNEWFVYMSETSSPSNSRGIYEVTDGTTSPWKNYAKTSYDNSKVNWGKTASDAWWETVRFDANMGEYIWTGFDYLGEPTPWNGTGTAGDKANYEPKSAYFGVIDIAGLPKDSYYLYRSMWYEQENDYTVHVLPTWDAADLPNNGAGNIKVDVYSNAPKVELVLEKADGTSRVVGTAKTMTEHKSTVGWTDAEGIHTYRTVDGVTQNHQSLYYTWNVPYEPGTLKAVAYDGKGADANVIDASLITGRTSVSTTKGADQLVLSVDEYTLEDAEVPTIPADGESLAYVVIEVQDEDGKFVNGAEPEVTVTVEGAGKLLAVDNGFQADHTPYSSNVWNAHRGKLVAIVQSDEEAGTITVKATADNDELKAGTVTINTTAATDGAQEVKAVSVEMSKIYYIKQGATPQLPEALTVHYSDKTSKELPVTWNMEGVSTTEEGTFSINGTMEGDVKVAINLQVIGEVAALQNYSTYMRVGQTPALPGSLPAITAEGEILNAFFNVDWDLSSINANVPGIYVVNGTADVFGKVLNPTASVRVTNGNSSQGNNVVETRTKFKTNISNETNKERVYDGGTESGYWQGTGSYTWGWDTAVNAYKVVLYMADTAPTSDSIHLSWSLAYEGSEYTDLDVKVANKRENGITVRTYDFTTVPAVGFQIQFDKEVKLYEAEIYTEISSFKAGSSAELAELEVKGKLADQKLLDLKQYATPATDVTADDIVAVGEDNAAVTVLPEYNGRILILTKSEDGTVEDVYTINLGTKEYVFPGGEYAPSTMSATGGNAQGAEPFSNVLDNNMSTLWHTDWYNTTPAENRYIELTMSEVSPVCAVRYWPRTNGTNGIVKEYRITYSVDGSEWLEVPGGTGVWAVNSELKTAMFDTIEAKAIRLYGVKTQSDQEIEFMSAAEIRLCYPQKDLSNLATVTLDTTEFEYSGMEIKPEPVVQALDGTTTLVKGQDYTVEYVNNKEAGRASVIVKGIGDYCGTIRVYFTITEKVLVVESFEPVAVSTAKGVAPQLPGTVTAVMTGGSKQELEVSWPEIPQEYYAQGGKFIVKGIVKGTELSPQAEITVTDMDATAVVAIEPFSVVTIPGTAPQLPNSVKVNLASGETEMRTVTKWETEGTPWEGGMTYYTAGIVEGTDIVAVAQVRVLPESAKANLAVNTGKTGFPQAYAKYASSANKMWNAVNGAKVFDNSDSNRWDNWERNVLDATTWFGVQFEAERLVTDVKLSFAQEEGTGSKVSLAADYDVEYYTGEDFTSGGNFHEVKNWNNSPVNTDANWTKVSYTATKPAVPTADNYQTAETAVNFTPVTTDFVRVLLTSQSQQWTGLVELEVYGYDISKYSDYEITSIKAGNVDLTANLVDGETYEYQLQENEVVPNIMVYATNNALVMIEGAKADAASGMVTITVTAEDGNVNSQKVYKINFVSAEESDVPVIEPEAQVTKVAVTADSQEVVLGGTVNVEATVLAYGEISKEVDWSVAAVDGAVLKQGTEIKATQENANKAVLTVATDETATKLMITATSKADETKKATAVVTVVNPLQEAKKALQNLVEEHENKTAEKYTEATWAVFENALNGAQAVLAKVEAGEAVTLDEVKSAKDALEAAVTGLTEKTPDVPPVTPDDPVIPDDGTWGDILVEDREGLMEVPAGIWAAGIEDLTYNGTKQTQEFRVYDGNKMLVAGKDYTASIKNNQNACTDRNSNKAPQVVLKMKGDYKGTKIIKFSIAPISISDESVVVDDLFVTYNGKKYGSLPVLSWNGKKLTSRDFTLGDIKADTTNPSLATVTITGQGNFTGERTLELIVGTEKTQIDMSKVKVTAPKKVDWTGEAIELTGVTVKNGKTTLTKDTDYTVSYENNKAAGTATLVITGTANKENSVSYHGVKYVTFTINGTPASKFVVNGLEKTYTYTGEEIEPSVSVSEKGGSGLPEGAYTVSYEKNVNKGTATMYLTGNPEKGYTGTKKVTFKIAAADLSTGSTVELVGDGVDAEDKVAYTAGGATPQVEVTDADGNKLVLGTDYTVSYKNNKAVAPATATKAPTVVIKGKGNYTKSTEKTFEIVQKQVEAGEGILTVSAKDKSLTNKAGSWKQTFKVYDVNGKALSANKDYDKTAVYYKVATEEGTEDINLNENPSTEIKVGDVIKIVVTLQGKNYSGKASGTYRIIDKNNDISKAVFKIAAKEYTGEEIELTETDITKAELKKAPLKFDDDYKVVKYEKNINKGTAKVTFQGIGNFGGEKTVTFKINQRDAVNNWWSGMVEALFN